MKQHIEYVVEQVEACPATPKEIREFLEKHLIQDKSARAVIQRKKKSLRQSINLLDENEDDDDDDIFELNEEEMKVLERKEYKGAMEESRYMGFMEEQCRHSLSGGQLTMDCTSSMYIEISKN